jgi:hypothetical protein
VGWSIKPERWYVYRINVDGRLGYIGKGTHDRMLYSARRLNGIAGVLRYFSDEVAAYRCEMKLIAQLRPPLNKSKGGEGGCLSIEVRTARELQTLCRRAYKKADETKGLLSILAAAAYARCELNSRGIKGWPEVEQDPERADPQVEEAIRRLNAWKQLRHLGLPRWTSC